MRFYLIKNLTKSTHKTYVIVFKGVEIMNADVRKNKNYANFMYLLDYLDLLCCCCYQDEFVFSNNYQLKNFLLLFSYWHFSYYPMFDVNISTKYSFSQ